MIKTKKDLKEYIAADLSYYYEKKNSFAKKAMSFLLKDNVQVGKRFITCLRKCEYHLNKSYRKSRQPQNILHDIVYLFKKRKLNIMQVKYGLEIYENCFDKGLVIYHTGGTVVHPASVIGRNCHLHGNNCIGNKGTAGSKSPVIGDNVSLGVGSKIIGDIIIANNVTVAAGAVVVHSCEEENVVLAGCPAHIVKRKEL
jgi:serine O-acetyltransferase